MTLPAIYLAQASADRPPTPAGEPSPPSASGGAFYTAGERRRERCMVAAQERLSEARSRGVVLFGAPLGFRFRLSAFHADGWAWRYKLAEHKSDGMRFEGDAEQIGRLLASFYAGDLTTAAKLGRALPLKERAA